MYGKLPLSENSFTASTTILSDIKLVNIAFDPALFDSMLKGLYMHYTAPFRNLTPTFPPTREA